eukprot:6176588-Pleurochrysis_carterae.AAC.1
MATLRASGSTSATTIRTALPTTFRLTLRHACQTSCCMRGMSRGRKYGSSMAARPGAIGGPLLTYFPVNMIGSPVAGSAPPTPDSLTSCLQQVAGYKTQRFNTYNPAEENTEHQGRSCPL